MTNPLAGSRIIGLDRSQHAHSTPPSHLVRRGGICGGGVVGWGWGGVGWGWDGGGLGWGWGGEDDSHFDEGALSGWVSDNGKEGG